MTYMQAQQISEHATISAFMDTNVRSLELLRAIETTCVAVGAIRDTLRNSVKLVTELSESLPSIEAEIPEDEIIKSLTSIEHNLELMDVRFNAAIRSAKHDPELTCEDGIEDVYAEAQHALCDLHEAVQEYKWSLMQHNAQFDTSDGGPKLSSADGIKAYLAAL